MSDVSAGKVTVSPKVLFQELDGEAVLLDLRSECYFGLDATGTRIWQLLDAHGDLDRVFQTMLWEYEVDATTLRRDLDRFIADLMDQGLLLAPGRDD